MWKRKLRGCEQNLSRIKHCGAKKKCTPHLGLGARVFLSLSCGIQPTSDFDGSSLPPNVSVSSSRFGFELRNKREETQRREFYAIPSLSEPKWFIASDGIKKSRLVNPTSLAARLVWHLFRLLQPYGLGGLIFPHRVIFDAKSEVFSSNYFGDLINGSDQVIALYIGAAGPLQKFTIELIGRENNLAFIKVGFSDRAKTAIRREVEGLNLISSLAINMAELPSYGVVTSQVRGCDPIAFRQEAVSAVELPKGYSELINSFLVELADLSLEEMTPQQMLMYCDLDDIVGYCEFSSRTSEAFSRLAASMSNPEIRVPMCLSHGDFTRWNLREGQGRLSVFDWEEVSVRPFGHDLFNFCFAELVLVAERTEIAGFIEVSKPLFRLLVTKTNIDNSFIESYFHCFHFFMLDRLRYYYRLKAENQDGSFSADASNRKVFLFLDNWVSQISTQYKG